MSRSLARYLRQSLVAGIAILLGGGCASGSRGQAEEQPGLAREAAITNTDPCAMRLHDICGALLLYYFNHFELPESLADLAPLSEDEPLPPMICPVTQVPYIYNLDGIYLPERNSWVILYDPAPAHSRMRWAVTVQQPPDETEMLVTKVIALPESFFVLRPPQ
jgi:hypothetical protein